MSGQRVQRRTATVIVASRRPEPTEPGAGAGEEAPAGEGAPVGDRVLAGEPVALVDLLDRVLARGVVVAGEVTLSIAGVDLVHVSLRALISSVHPGLYGEDRRAAQ